MPTAAAFGPETLATRLAALIGSFPRARIAVALSGGGDSLALLAALAAAARRRRGLALRAIHIDHGLQPLSRRWARQCARQAAALRVPFVLRRVTGGAARGQSLEAAARAARYAALAQLLADGECLLTAHHLEDQAETVLLQLVRGAGVAGLAAMPEEMPLGRGRLLRPLLDVPRAALKEYLACRKLAWIEDPMNVDVRFDRAYVRSEILPRLAARWPGAARALARSARHAQDAGQLLTGIALQDLAAAADGPDLSVVALRRLSPGRRRNLLRHWIAERGARMPDSRRLAEIAGPLLAARADAQPLVKWSGWGVRRTAGRLCWIDEPGEAPEHEPAGAKSWSWRENPGVWLPGARGRLEIRPDLHGDLDLDALPAELTVRWRRGGERLRPRRGGPSREVKSLLQEGRVAAWERATLPLLFAGDRLVAVGDRWLDAGVQAHEGARARGRIVWHRSPRRARPGERDLLI